MSFFKSVTDFLTGGAGKAAINLGGTIVKSIAGQFPDKLSDKDKADIQLAVDNAIRDHDIKLLALAQQEDQRFNDRIKDMEGTANDLLSAGWIGKLIIMLRGAQRPIWGYFVLYMDYMVFSGRWDIVSPIADIEKVTDGLNMVSAFWLINFLVLGFLFGERAIRNVLPIIKSLLNK